MNSGGGVDYGPRGPPPPHPNEQPSSTVPHHPNQFHDQYRQFSPQYRGYSPHYPPGYMPSGSFKGFKLLLFVLLKMAGSIFEKSNMITLLYLNLIN